MSIPLSLAGCDDRPGGWAAIVYPDGTDRSKFVVTPHFTMASYCLEAAKETMEKIQTASGGDYECGYDCELDGDPHKMNVCKKKDSEVGIVRRGRASLPPILVR